MDARYFKAKIEGYFTTLPSLTKLSSDILIINIISLSLKSIQHDSSANVLLTDVKGSS